MMASFAVAGPPYTIDGDLTDWGITPFTDWAPDSPTAECEVHDFNGLNPIDNPDPYPDSPYGNELFDVEMMCFDDYTGIAYFASVTSMPPGGDSGYIMGDLALDIDADSTTGEYGYEYGIKLIGPDKGMICYMPDWHPVTDILINTPGSFTCDGPSSVVQPVKADVSYVNAGITDYPIGCTSGDFCYDNYIIEIKAMKSMIGLPEGESGPVHFTQSCGNDDIHLWITWDYALPEFVSAGVPLLILVLAPGLSYVFVRKRRK